MLDSYLLFGPPFTKYPTGNITFMIDFILDSIRGNMIKSDRNLEIIDKRRDSMISKSQVVVRYAETDQMGIVHHSNYPVWYEIGRTDLIKETGIT